MPPNRAYRRRHRVLSAILSAALCLSVWTTAPSVCVKAVSEETIRQQMADLQRQEEVIRERLAANKGDLTKQQEYADSLQEKIQNTRQQIDLMQQQESLLADELDATAVDLQRQEAAISDKEKELSTSHELLCQRLREIARTGQLTDLQMLLDTDGFVDFLMKRQVTQRIADHDARLMNNLEENLSVLEEEKARLADQQQALADQQMEMVALRTQCEEKKRELDTLYAESRAVIRGLQAAAGDLSAELKERERQQAALEQTLQQLMQQNAGGGQYTRGSMFWPVPVVHALSDTYRMRGGKLHKGIDIANGPVAIYGQNIVAAADGEVIYVNKSGPGGGYGLFIMIDHGKDTSGRQVVTLYAHCSAVLVNKGDRVTGGQSVIARAGDSGNSEGPHLHFEVRLNGSPVDPLKGYVSP